MLSLKQNYNNNVENIFRMCYFEEKKLKYIPPFAYAYAIK